MEVEDEVLEEYDVYLNKNLSQNLHIFRYMGQNSPINDHKDVEVRARPNHKMFEIETKMDTKSVNFDQKKSEFFGRNLENDKNDEKTNVCKTVTKSVLKSVEVKPTLGQYCVAFIRDDCPEIHLNPINSLIQFKPKLYYINNKLEQTATKGKTNTKEESEDNSSQDESEVQNEIQTITMRFAGPDEDKLKKARERSFNYFQQQVAKDPWTPINCHPIQSQVSVDNKLSLIYNSTQINSNINGSTGSNSTTDSNDNNITISSLEDFLSTLKCSHESKPHTSSPSVNVSLSEIRLLPFAEQIRLILINAKILSFDQIMRLLMDRFEPNSVLKSVQIYALLVQGNWVVKSEVLYNKDVSAFSPITGIPIELLCRARDYIIWRFTQTKSLLKKDIFSSPKSRIPDEDCVQILSQIAVFDKNTKYWNFLLPEDNNFIEKYPEVVQRQQLLWTNRCLRIERIYTTIKTDENNTKTTQRKRRNSRKVSDNSNSDDNDVIDSMTPDLNASVEINSFCSPTKVKNDRKSPIKTTKGKEKKERRNSKTTKIN